MTDPKAVGELLWAINTDQLQGGKVTLAPSEFVWQLTAQLLIF